MVFVRPHVMLRAVQQIDRAASSFELTLGAPSSAHCLNLRGSPLFFALSFLSALARSPRDRPLPSSPPGGANLAYLRDHVVGGRVLLVRKQDLGLSS